MSRLLFLTLYTYTFALAPAHPDLDNLGTVGGNVTAPQIPRGCGSLSHSLHHPGPRPRPLTPHPSQVYSGDEGAHPAPRSLGVGTAPTSPIRITPVFIPTALSTLTAAQKTFLQTVLIPSAISKWSSLLTVVPVSGNLFAHRDCLNVWSNTPTLQCATFVPTTYCAQGFDEVNIPLSSYLGIDYYYPNSPNQQSSVPAQGVGLPNSDFAIFVTAFPSSTCTSAAGADVLAYASACQRDSQSDRPTFGRINFCPSHLSADPSEWTSQLSTATHELAHALGFSGDGLPLFRYPDGSPRTPRSSYDSTFPADPYFVQYTCPTDGQLYGEYMASSLTVQFFFERGSLPCTWTNNGASGSFIPLVDGTTRVSSCVARVVTPIATAAAQWYTGCSTLPGPEFDHTDGACSIYGSHWAARVMGQELMSPLLWHRQLTSPLTLAFFADSGWYGVAWPAVYQPRLGDWMFQQGCALNQGRCTSANVGTNPQHFFTASTPTASQRSGVCTTDREAVAYVTVNQYSAPLSPAFQYFPSTSSSSFAAFGGYAEYDFCPVPIPYSNYVCTTPGVTATSTQRARGESFGASSRCFLSTLSSSSSPTSTAGCYTTTCSSSPPYTLTITAAGGGVGVCTTAGSTIGISGYSGSVTCPDPATVCGSSPLPPFSPPAVPNFPITPSPTPTSRPTVNTIKYALLFTAAASTTPFAAAAAQASLVTTLGGGLGKGGVSVTVDSVSLLPAGADTRQRRVELWGAAERETVAAGGHPLMAWGAGQGGGGGGGGEDKEEGTDGGGGGASSTPTTPTIISKRDALALNRHRVMASSSQGVRVVFSSPTSSLLTALSLPSSTTTMGALSVALGNALSSTTLLASIASTSPTSPTTLGYSAVMMDPTSSIAYFPVTGPQQSWAAPPTPGITPGGGGGGGSTSTTSSSAYNYALYLYIAIAVIVLFSLVSSLRGWHARRQQQRVLSGAPDAMEMEGGGPRGGGPPPPLLYSGGEIPMATYAAPPPQGYPGSGGGGRGYAPQPYPNYPNAGIYPPPPVGSYVQPPPSSRRGPPGGGRGMVV